LDEKKEKRILAELETIYPLDLSIKEVSQRVKLSEPTASTYLKVLEAQRRIEVSRKVGNAVFYRIKRRRHSA
jgi:DNA-binding Lrp family transcriptional regulator